MLLMDYQEKSLAATLEHIKALNTVGTLGFHILDESTLLCALNFG